MTPPTGGDPLPSAVHGDAFGEPPPTYDTTTTDTGWIFSGAATIGSRFYLDDSPFPSWVHNHFPMFSDEVLYPKVSGWAKAVYTSPNQQHRFTAQLFGRYDFENERDLFDVPAANYYFDGGSWDFLVGFHKVFWGVAESRHVVDIINQVDLTGDPNRESRLGQPMVNVNLVSDVGTFSLFGLFWFREQDFDWASDRLPIGLIVNEDEAEFEDGEWRNAAFAARYSNTLNMGNGSLDYALSFFTGTARDPRFEVAFDLDEHPPIFLKPVYDHIDQVGAEALYVYDNLQLKFEGVYQRQNGENVFAAVGGFEYTFNSVLNSNVDLGIVGEYLYDSRDEKFSAYALVDNEIFAGLRLGWNNSKNTSVLAGAVFGVDDDARYYTLEASSLITDSLQITLEGRFFDNIPKDNAFYLWNNQDYLELALTKFF